MMRGPHLATIAAAQVGQLPVPPGNPSFRSTSTNPYCMPRPISAILTLGSVAPFWPLFQLACLVRPHLSVPKARQWRCRQSVTERHDVRAVVQDDAKGKAVSARLGQGPQAAEITGFDRRARLDLNACDHPVITFQHDV